MCKLCCSLVSVSLCTADLAADVKRSRDFCRHGRDPAVSKSVSSAMVARTDGGNAEMKAEKTRHENKGITQKTECAVKPNPPMLNKFRRAPAALKLVAEKREERRRCCRSRLAVLRAVSTAHSGMLGSVSRRWQRAVKATGNHVRLWVWTCKMRARVMYRLYSLVHIRRRYFHVDPFSCLRIASPGPARPSQQQRPLARFRAASQGAVVL